jgi:hypothetical protein
MPRSNLTLALVAMVFASLAEAQEQSIAIKDAPTAVIQNVSARFPNAKVAGVVRETDDEGRPVFEVTLKQNGRNIDVTTTLAGQLTLIEREIRARDLPRAVSKLLAERYPKAKFEIAESVVSVSGATEVLSFYEVLLVDTKKQRWEVQVAPDGSKILKVEKKVAGEPN